MGRQDAGYRSRVARTLAGLCTLTVLVACGEAGPTLAEREAAARAAQEAADQAMRQRTRAAREAERLAAAWRYQQATIGGGAQVTAAIFAAEDVDTDGQGARAVQLVFRDHEKWGRSAYLVLEAGDFACRPRCTVQVSADDREPQALAAWRPETDDAIAMFIEGTAVFWRLTADAARLTIAFPVTAGGTRTATFDVAGLDESKMPGW
jgi:hypothetical protein